MLYGYTCVASAMKLCERRIFANSALLVYNLCQIYAARVSQKFTG